MNLKKSIMLILKLIILVLLIFFLILFLSVPKTNCDACQFKINGEKKSIHEFVEIYYERCVDPFKKDMPDLNWGVGGC